MVIFNLSFLVKYITRFTEECFVTLIAVVFIIDGIKKTIALKDTKPPILVNASLVNSSMEQDVVVVNKTFQVDSNASDTSLESQLEKATMKANFFFSCLLFVFTFCVCVGLKSFRNKPFLTAKVDIYTKFMYICVSPENIIIKSSELIIKYIFQFFNIIYR
jgi:hypothetical protein